MNPKNKYLVFLAAAALALSSFFFFRGRPAGNGGLFFYCGAGLRPVAEEIIALFTDETGIAVTVDYGPSNMLLGRIRLSGEGDVFMPGDEYYVDEAQKDGLIHYRMNASSWVPVIMAGEGNPSGISALGDLVKPGIRLGLADERTAAVGRVSMLIFEKNAVSRESVEETLVYEGVTAHDLATSVNLGHIDAAIVWKPIAAAYENAAIIHIPPEENVLSPIPIAVLSSSVRKDDAIRFAHFFLSDKSREIFSKYNYGSERYEK